MSTSNSSRGVYVSEKLNDLPVHGIFLIGLLLVSLFANLLIALCMMGLGRNKRDIVPDKTKNMS